MINVGIDCDGVQFDFCKLYSQVINNMWPAEKYPIYTTSEVPQWGWESWHPAGAARVEEAWKMCHKMDNFFELEQVLNREQVSYMVSKLNNHPKVNVYHITSRAATAGKPVIKQTITQLEGIGWSNPQVIISFSKGGIARVLDLKYFIDDRAENCAEVALYNPTTKVFVYDQPYNRFLPEQYFKITRTNSLVAFTDQVLEAAEKS